MTRSAIGSAIEGSAIFEGSGISGRAQCALLRGVIGGDVEPISATIDRGPNMLAGRRKSVRPLIGRVKGW
jgi:hypothetical protein